MNNALKNCLVQYFGTSDINELSVDETTRQCFVALAAALKPSASSHMGELLTEHNQLLADELSQRLEKEKALQQEKQQQAELIRRLEEAHNQLLQSEKMASIGSLAAGVAHEINNPIGFVGSNLNALRDYVEDLLSIIDAYTGVFGTDKPASLVELERELDLPYLKADTLMLLDECKDGIGRVKRIVQDLKDFSHVDHADWVITDLHKGLDSTLNIVNNEIKYKAVVEKHYGQVPEVFCIGSQLNQVFMNLLVNAAHAIESNGVIDVTTCHQKGWIWVEIRDNGKGIAPEHLKRIFDPFFTTKPVGQGTGLGLSLSYGIVKRHGGRIEVESTLGEGTAFKVWIPEHPELLASEDLELSEANAHELG